MRRRIDELHLLLPLYRADSRLPPRGDTSAHCTSLLPCIHFLRPELVALRAFRGALLPHRGRMRYIRGWSDHLHVNISDRASLLCHVSAGYGVFLRLPTDSAMGLGNSRTAKGEESGHTCTGNCCVECDKHRYRLSVPCMERTVSITAHTM
jgi:hypothetical protein